MPLAPSRPLVRPSFLNRQRELPPIYCARLKMPEKPVSQILVASLPHAPVRPRSGRLGSGAHPLPFPWRRVPCAPTTRISVGRLLHTWDKGSVTPLELAVQATPLKCRIVPPSPTAQTS